MSSYSSVTEATAFDPESTDFVPILHHLPIAAHFATTPIINTFRYLYHPRGLVGMVEGSSNAVNEEGITVYDAAKALVNW